MTRRSLWLLALSGGWPGLASCLPELDARASNVTEPRPLAVVAEPPEARPGARVSYELLAVTANGREPRPAAAWTTCDTPLAAVDPGSVSPECLLNPGPALEDRAGARAAAALPANGCALFGPDPPPGDARPRDPDVTGGFYQPIVVFTAGGPLVHLQRIVCNPRSAPADLARELAAAYVPNVNPAPPLLELADGSPLPAATSPGNTLLLRARWQPEAAEAYAWIDRDALELRERREAMSVSWFATGGSFDADRSDRAEDDPSTQADNAWTAPDGPDTTTLWAVLRDSRGGTAFVESSLRVEP